MEPCCGDALPRNDLARRVRRIMKPDLAPCRWRGAALVVVAAALSGCASAPPERHEKVPPVLPSPASPLATERRWLDAWFHGTPVRIAQHDDGPLEVDVPLEFSFDAGRSRVKPPLAAVLAKVAESLRRVPHARLQRIAAPGDVAGDSILGQQRAGHVRNYLRDHGVQTSRLAAPSSTIDAKVSLRIEP